MNPSAWNHQRLVVPRWRSLNATLASAELAVPSKNLIPANSADADAAVLEAHTELWQTSPNLLSAAELVEAALVRGLESNPTVVEAAKLLLRQDIKATPMIKAQAAVILDRSGKQSLSATTRSGSELREMTRINPRDALAWVELSLHQTVTHSPKAATRSMAIALFLRPNDRHVLRSAARLFLHQGDREAAHDLIVRNAASKSDPWLMAAEISLARLAERTPRLFKRGVILVEEGDLSPRHITELASALGTAELLDGSRRKSRRMFSQSLRDPTGNALAQGEWAANHLGSDLVPSARFRTAPEPYEAAALHAYRGRMFERVPAFCERWAETDLYSIRPFEFGATAAAYAEDFQIAERFAREGLKRRPDAIALTNFLAFALNSQDRPLEAKKVLERLSPGADEVALAVATANKGQCAMRLNRQEEGISLYRKSIEEFKRLKAHQLAASAHVYLAKEAKVACLSDADRYVNDAKEAMKEFQGAEVYLVLQRLIGETPILPNIENEEDPNLEHNKKLRRLRSVVYTTPGLPNPPRKLII